MSVQSEVPVVDLEDLSSPRAERKRKAEDALRIGFGRFGLVYIANHGIDAQDLESFYDQWRAFTGKPTAEKEKLSMGEIWFQRGWTPPDTERAVASDGQPDFKECFFVAPEPLDPVGEAQYPEIYARNVWPDDAGFKESYLEIGHQLHEVGLSLLRGSARSLGLEPYRFEAAIYGGPHVTRALYYLPLDQSQVERNVLWGEEHTDFNLLTLLPGGRFIDQQGSYCPRPDDNSGLYLRTRATAEDPAGQMVPGKPPAGCIVAQVGQQLEILTGGTFLATPHVIKAPATPGYSRVSMAHFIHLHAHQLLYPLEPFRNPATVKSYSPPVLAGTYGTKTLVDIGLAPKEALTKLGYRHYDRLDKQRKLS